eukprot:TRINITY_DN17970_c0_g1_i1.p1 TRINITY_DN17970_c0_g1~~TRINITY_DN17970_c0_g1_i1.p1  ORF type:complete len:371 (-),score=52.95 TRINITY_DN17970_c0_g1_i1:46-1158(-)
MELIQMDTGAVCPEASNAEWKGRNMDAHAFKCIKSPLAAISSANGEAGGSTSYARGCSLLDESTDGFSEALAVASSADVIVLGLGISERNIESPYLEHETHDRDSIDLPPVLKRLAKELLGLGKPVVVFLLNGGMVAVDELLSEKDEVPLAIIEAFYPGAAGAQAISDAIFGKANRWGKMPYTVYPANWTQNNSMLDMDVTRQRTYRYGANAVVAFGTGLSLTRFKLSFQALPQHMFLPTADVRGKQSIERTYSVKVHNAGLLMGDEVVMAYFKPLHVNLPQYPNKSLFDFRRVSDLAPGADAVVTFAVGQDSIVLANDAGDLVRAPGKYMLCFENGAGEVLETELQLTGEQVLVEAFPLPSDAETVVMI